jgi:hypothetical protein
VSASEAYAADRAVAVVPVAQWTEQPPSKRKVAGSNPAGGATPLVPGRRELDNLALHGQRGKRECEGLQRRFAAIDGVERLAWEDREHFLLRVRPGTDLDRLRDEVIAALRAAGAATRAAS